MEDLHAGERSALLDDPSLSRITDEEMKNLMIETSAMVARFLWMRDNNPVKYWKEIEYFTRAYCHNWVRDDVDENTKVVPSRRSRAAID